MQVVFDEKAIDFLNGLPREIRERIFSKILSAKENPFHFFVRLKGCGAYRMRIGDYRVVADIESEKISVALIGHRKDVYS